MLRWNFLCFVVSPLVGIEVYLLFVWLADVGRHSRFFSENGLVELATAAFFLVAGLCAARLVYVSRHSVPAIYRFALMLFALGACFVALEELSYGQHLFGWSPPAYFAKHSTKNELNLHNLYGDRLSETLRLVAVIGFPVGAIILPLVMCNVQGSFREGSWSYYLLPRTELITIVAIAQSITLFDRLSRWLIGGNLLVRPGEVQEFWWSIAAAVYVSVMRKRWTVRSEEYGTVMLRPNRASSYEIREAA